MARSSDRRGDRGQAPCRWRPHPWHGLPAGPDPPAIVHAYVEMTPFDLVKYEIDEETGHLLADRPQRNPSVLPSLYGFIPQTYCGATTARINPDSDEGDEDPLDICVLSEQSVSRVDVIVRAKVIGGIRTIDHGKADDKILAVLEGDLSWGHAEGLDDVPKPLVDRLIHYLGTYKLRPDGQNPLRVQGTYEQAKAFEVIRAARADYEQMFPGASETETTWGRAK